MRDKNCTPRVGALFKTQALGPHTLWLKGNWDPRSNKKDLIWGLGNCNSGDGLREPESGFEEGGAEEQAVGVSGSNNSSVGVGNRCRVFVIHQSWRKEVCAQFKRPQSPGSLLIGILSLGA